MPGIKPPMSWFVGKETLLIFCYSYGGECIVWGTYQTSLTYCRSPVITRTDWEAHGWDPTIFLSSWYATAQVRTEHDLFLPSFCLRSLFDLWGRGLNRHPYILCRTARQWTKENFECHRRHNKTGGLDVILWRREQWNSIAGVCLEGSNASCS